MCVCLGYGEICVSDMPPSCLCFAEMSIYFRFGEFRANSICPIFRQGHGKNLYDFGACMHFVYNPFACYTVQSVMKVSGWNMERYMQSAVMDMSANNRTRIRCPCTRCKEGVL